MLNIYKSDAKERNDRFREEARRAGEGNVDWLRRNLDGGVARKGGARKSRAAGASEGGVTRLLLVGGRTLGSFRLRVAQAHLRHDFTPSHWSHVAMLGTPRDDLAETVVHEISLEPPGGFGGVTPSNGLQKGRLGAYDDPELYPNVGLVNVPVARERLTPPLVKFQHQRAILDGPQAILAWLAYVWGAGRGENPLVSGQGVPSAAMIEVVVGAEGFDLTPGLESRSSCPETIYQAAKWWNQYYEQGANTEPLTGAYHVGERIDFRPDIYAEGPGAPVVGATAARTRSRSTRGGGGASRSVASAASGATRSRQRRQQQQPEDAYSIADPD